MQIVLCLGKPGNSKTVVSSFSKTAPAHLLLKAVIILTHGLRMGEVNLRISSLTEVKRKGAMPRSQSPARIKGTLYHIGGDVLFPIQPQLYIFKEPLQLLLQGLCWHKNHLSLCCTTNYGTKRQTVGEPCLGFGS